MKKRGWGWEKKGREVGGGKEAKITLVECELGGSVIYSMVLGGGGKVGGEGIEKRIAYGGEVT